MEHSLGSVGGFCAGSAMVVSHQRLSGSGYCFSASLPAFATCAALSALKLIDDEPARVQRLHAASAALAPALEKHLGGLEHVHLDYDAASPIVHIGLTAAARNCLSTRQQERLLRAASVSLAKAREGACVQLMLHSGLAHIQAPRPPTLRLVVHSEVPPGALDGAVSALGTALRAELAKASSALALAPTVDDVALTKSANKAAELATALLAEGGSSGGSSSAGVSSPSRGGAGAGLAEVSADALPTAEEAQAVTIPVLYALEYIRQVSRRYVLRQMEWHAFWLAPQLKRLRANRSPTLHLLFTLGHFFGSEAFYLLTIPVLCWSLGQKAHMNMFVAYFALNMYAGNWLKNFFALGRPVREGTPARDAADYGWPSMYAVNAVGLPFFALRYWFGGFGQGTVFSAEHELFTGVSYALGILWVLVVCGARLYSGSSSPADVQGGMLVGGILVRIWLPVCEDVDRLLSADGLTLYGLPQATFLMLLAALLMLLHPFTPSDPRSWTALAASTKAVAFTTSYIIGSNYCADQAWCAAFEPPPFASLGLAQASLSLVLRSMLGFAMLFGASYTAAAVARATEPTLRLALPSKPCAPRLARSAAVFTANGLMVSMGVPTALAAIGL